MKIFHDTSYVWQRALLQRSKGIDEELIQRDIEGTMNYILEHFHKDVMPKISDGQNHIIKFVKNYWADEDIYGKCSQDVGGVLRLYNIDLQPSDIEWLKQFKPYDVYFMIDEENQLEEARNLLFPKDSFSMTVLKHNYKDSEITAETYHRNCSTCGYYNKENGCLGCAPCIQWGKIVVSNEFCSRWTEDFKKK